MADKAGCCLDYDEQQVECDGYNINSLQTLQCMIVVMVPVMVAFMVVMIVVVFHILLIF